MAEGGMPTRRRRASARSGQCARGTAVRATALLALTALAVVGALGGSSAPAFVSAPVPTAAATEARRVALLRTFGIASGVVAAAEWGSPASVRAEEEGKGGKKSKWFGAYSDPNHEGNERKVYINYAGTGGKLAGADVPRGRTSFSLKVGLEGPDANEMTIFQEGRSAETRDPLEKPGEPVVVKWDRNGFVFPDGVKWLKFKTAK
mmetsp:Transcript_20542/g.43703  ORF Transcript_20542/g.43703 Transcript_20542/m.43703 type:complete len:205 (-) Transcript_20542:114-728(-)